VNTALHARRCRRAHARNARARRRFPCVVSATRARPTIPSSLSSRERGFGNQAGRRSYLPPGAPHDGENAYLTMRQRDCHRRECDAVARQVAARSHRAALYRGERTSGRKSRSRYRLEIPPRRADFAGTTCPSRKQVKAPISHRRAGMTAAARWPTCIESIRPAHENGRSGNCHKDGGGPRASRVHRQDPAWREGAQQTDTASRRNLLLSDKACRHQAAARRSRRRVKSRTVRRSADRPPTNCFT